MITYADSAIKKAIVKHPEREKYIWSCFMACRTSSRFLSAPEVMYQAHIDEIVDRAIHNIRLSNPTYAEIVFIISDTSLLAPLQTSVIEMAFYCINKFSPELAKELFTGYEPRFIEETEREISNLKNARETQVDRDYNFESWESKQDQELSLL